MKPAEAPPGSPLAALVRGYELLNAGHLEAVLDLFDPAIEGRQSSRIVGTAGHFEGRDGMRAMFAELSEGFAQLHFDCEELLQSGHRILALVRMSGSGQTSGVPVEGTLAHVWTTGENGFRSFEVYANRARAAADVGVELPAGASLIGPEQPA